MRILITGAAGFIGSALALKFLNNKHSVLGIDNINSYYNIKLKLDRLKIIENNQYKNSWVFKKCDLSDSELVNKIFLNFRPDIVVNLAAQAGVRDSTNNSNSYILSNVLGFHNILEACKNNKVGHLVYASSSSVYGANKKFPFHENDLVDHPVSLYAATKKSNELMAHTYSHIFGLPTTGLRFFTVYGPWGRPDMAPIIFAKSIAEGKILEIFNHGKLKRDFTFIDDIVHSTFLCSFKPATIDKSFDPLNPNPSTSFCPFRIFNVGNSVPTDIMEFISILEKELGLSAKKKFLPLQAGDVEATHSDSNKLSEWIKFSPKTELKDGVSLFVKWFKSYYKF